MEGDAEAVAGGAAEEVVAVVEAPDVVDAETVKDVVDADGALEIWRPEPFGRRLPSGPDNHIGLCQWIVILGKMAVEAINRDDFP